MTSSASFSAGLSMAGLDMQGLHDVVAAACAAGGVAGPTVARTVFAAAGAISLAHVNALLAAYQRAWDISWNKPGTRQALYTLAEVRAANGYPGARLAAVWTQCPQMIFHQTWPTWNDVTPELLMDDNVFVSMFDGAAGAGEVGMGGGLSGADATLTPQDATMPGYNATYLGRGLTTTEAHHYNLTGGFIQQMLSGRDRFTLICHCHAAGQVASNNTGPFSLQWSDASGYTNRIGFLFNNYGWYAILRDYQGFTYEGYDAASPFRDVLNGPLWFGVYSRADGVWMGLSQNRPDTHADWDWKHQIAPQRITFGNVASGGCCVWTGYSPWQSYGMKNIYQRYFVASKTEFF